MGLKGTILDEGHFTRDSIKYSKIYFTTLATFNLCGPGYGIIGLSITAVACSGIFAPKHLH